MDIIRMKGLTFFAFHGVLPEEQRLGQRFIVDLDLYADLEQAGERDDIQQSVNYALVYEVVNRVMEQPSVQTLERLAHLVMEALFAEFERIQGIQTEVLKPGAPIPGMFDSVSVVLERWRVDL